MLLRNFKDTILINPIKQGATCLKIIVGYATHTMASWHLEEIKEQFQDTIQSPIKITLLIGMCNFDGLSMTVHNGLKQLVEGSSQSCFAHLKAQYIYKGAPIHSKLYLWEREEKPFCAFMGSANYTQIAFSTKRRELMKECDANEAAEYFDSVESDSIYCDHAEVEEYIKLRKTYPMLEEGKNHEINLRDVSTPHVSLSFITRNGETGKRSGINWGQREGREPNQAYIPLPAQIARSKFFPLEKQHFSVLTDDGKQLILRVEQQNNKAITTPANNSLLGEYFRNRLGVPNGAFVTAEDFKKYGRTEIAFYKLDEEQFFMDFSV